MKKKIILFIAATLTLAMTACGSENVNVETEMNGRFEVIKDIEVTTPTAEPTKEVEATTAPTATSTPTVEPTTEPTVEPTATSTPTPEPTSTPVPTEAPVVEAKDWEKMLRELHSLETYAEREAYVNGLDASIYEVAAVDNFDLFAGNCYEERDPDNPMPIDFGPVVGYEVYDDSDSDEPIAVYTSYDEIPADITAPRYVVLDDWFRLVGEYASYDEIPDDIIKSFENDEGLYYVEKTDIKYGYSITEAHDPANYVYATVKVVTYLAVERRLGLTGEFESTNLHRFLDEEAIGENADAINEAGYGWSGSVTDSEEEFYLMTITNLTTGETDPWGVRLHYSEYDSDDDMLDVITIEKFIDAHNEAVFGSYTTVSTWDTLKYYDDIYTPQTSSEEDDYYDDEWPWWW